MPRITALYRYPVVKGSTPELKDELRATAGRPDGR